MAEPSAKRDREFMEEALAEARAGLGEGGIPIGSVLVLGDQVVGRGHNRRIQKGNPILHGEMDALQNAGRLRASEYRRSTLYTTLSPCDMCSGAILLYGIPRVVMAENRTFLGAEVLLRSRGVEVVDLDLEGAVDLMRKFIGEHPDVWNEDVGA
ncbi:MAG: nucleoside deaminase [Planctomycetota bacterium]